MTQESAGGKNSFKKIICVVNPNSANKRTGRELPQIVSQIERKLGRIDVEQTRSQGHATELVRQANKAGADLIIAVGGDGTMNEAANGFFEPDGTPITNAATLSMIPRGTGGDYRKTFGLGLTLEEAIDRIQNGSIRSVDVGRMKAYDFGGNPVAKHYINILSFGVSGLVDYYCNTSSKALGGKASFFIATIKGLARWKNRKIRLELDGGKVVEELVIQTLAVANGRYFGGGMMMAPDADPSDGLFDVVAMGDFTLLESIKDGSKIYKGKHLESPKVKTWRASKIKAEAIDAGEHVYIDMDGETPGRIPIEIEMLHKAVKLAI